jgi:hypothetical protein
MELLDFDPETGECVWHEYDDLTQTTTLTTIIDLAPCLERNKQDKNDGSNGYSPSRELQRVASIPNVLIEKWLNEEGIDVFNNNHWPAVARKLNSSEYMYLRTGGGRLAGKLA